MTELKPCPFCGGKAVLCENTDYAYVYCKECGSQTDESHGTAGAAVAAWNTRVERTCRFHDADYYSPGAVMCDCGAYWFPENAKSSFVFCPNCGAKVVK